MAAIRSQKIDEFEICLESVGGTTFHLNQNDIRSYVQGNGEANVIIWLKNSIVAGLGEDYCDPNTISLIFNSDGSIKNIVHGS